MSRITDGSAIPLSNADLAHLGKPPIDPGPHKEVANHQGHRVSMSIWNGELQVSLEHLSEQACKDTLEKEETGFAPTDLRNDGQCNLEEWLDAVGFEDISGGHVDLGSWSFNLAWSQDGPVIELVERVVE